MNVFLSITHPTPSSPIIISIPHSGIEIPELIQNRINLQARRIHTDWHVDLLVKDFPFTKVSTSISRYVVDVNRSKYTSKTSALPIIPRYDEFGIPLFKQYPSKNFQNEWIAKYYTPYYDAVNFVIEGDSLIAPFRSIPGLGLNVANKIVEARQEQPFISKKDLATRGKVSKTLIDYMTENKVLDDLPDENQLSLFDF